MAVAGLLRSLGVAGGRQKDDSAALRLEVLDDFEQAGIGWIWASDAEGRLIYLSSAAADKLGRETADMVGQPIISLFQVEAENPDGNDRPLNFQLSARNRITDVIVRVEPATHSRDRTWWSISGQPKIDSAGRLLGYRGSAKDVTVEFRRKLEDTRLAEHDSLTGLFNRHHMQRKLDSTLAACKMSKRSCGLMMLDLDRFKQVNDTMGHPAGDELLRQVAERLGAVIGEKGCIGRLGGDEFQVILPDMDDRGTLGSLADKIIQILSSPYQIDGRRAIIGSSVGICVAPYDGVEPEEIVRGADLALYSAKNGGRGVYRFYSSDLKDVEQERQIILDDLREALASDQLKLHYQPVVRTRDNAVVCFEALMRWDHPDRGSVSPGVFIPVAEGSELINHIGHWALRRACEDALQWPNTVRVAVNVSAKQFVSKGFVAQVTSVLAETGIDPDRLELELTESVFMGDSDETDATFKALKALGLRIALDDFGTGYSSLSYLRSAPFDKIKVDKSFVDTCTQKNENSAKIIAAIIGLSKALGMDTTVEGVEAFDQFDLVCSKGAEYIQGWIYSKALPQPDLLATIAAGEYKIEPSGPDTYRPERRSVFRRIGVIHEDHRYEAVMRDLSKTGARIEGLLGVPVGTGLVLDLGAGQLAVSQVRHVQDIMIGVEFETPLVSDGAGGLVTRHRVSPYVLAAAGMPLAALPQGRYPLAPGQGDGPRTAPAFMEVPVSRS
jgi:diguanylate cyclase (GGDEF)-like protein